MVTSALKVRGRPSSSASMSAVAFAPSPAVSPLKSHPESRLKKPIVSITPRSRRPRLRRGRSPPAKTRRPRTRGTTPPSRRE
eukprot:470377-Rhodomonas_salina.1